MSRGCLWLSWTSALQGELCLPLPSPPPLSSLPPSVAAAKLTRAALHSEGLANMDMLTYRIWVGPSAFRGKMASVLSSRLSLNSFMTAGWLKYTEGLNHHMPYKSYQRDSCERQEHFEDRRIFFFLKERKAVGRCLNAKSSHVFCAVFMN